jgi:hypothetical protein
VKRLCSMMTRSLLAAIPLAGALGSRALHAQSVTTWHNDIGRTGQNTNETVLTQSNVTQNMFGRQCHADVDGKVYAQPLVLTDVLFQGQTTRKTIAYVVTQNDSVYAFDASNCTVLTSQGQPKSLLQPGEEAALCADLHNCTVSPKVGILSTPVIEITGSNPTRGTLYAVAESECPSCGQNGANVFYHRLYALDIASLAETNGGHVQICSSGCGKYATGSDFSLTHYQRPGLLFLDSTKTGLNNTVYAAFSMIDGGTNDPNEFIYAYDARHVVTTAPLTYETTDGVQKKRRGGIWQGGAGLMAAKDANGGYHLYFSTGDGDFDLDQLQSPDTDAADSFLKLNTDLGTLSVSPQPYYFTPSDQYWRGCNTQQNPNDGDFGSGGTLAIPESTFAPQPQFFAVKPDKKNYLWVMDRTAPGGYNGGGSNQNCGSTQNCNTPCANANNNQESFQFSNLNCSPNPCQARSTPAFWGGKVSIGDQGELYLAGSFDQLKRYPVSSSCTPGPVCNTAAASTTVDPTGTVMGYSATPSISSNATTLNTGVVWAIKTGGLSTAPVLYAFKADDLTELYDTGQCHINGRQVDQPGLPTSFSIPTIANGQIYIGTFTDFDIYGSVTTRTCLSQ